MIDHLRTPRHLDSEPIYSVDQPQQSRDISSSSRIGLGVQIGSNLVLLHEYLSAGFLLLQNNELDEAAKAFKNALLQDAFSTAAIAGLYWVFSENSRLEEAQRLVDVVETFEDDPYVLFLKADARYRLEKYEEALPYFYELMTIAQPEFEFLFDVYKNLGNSLVRLRDFEGAEEFYNKAYALNRNSDVLMVNFGTLEIQKMNYDAAAERFRIALQINSSNDKAWTGLALIHDVKSDRRLALASVEKALDCDPTNKTALQIFLSWTQELQYLSRIRDRFESYLDHKPDDIEVNLHYADLLFELKEFEAAEMEIFKILAFDANEVRAVALRAKIKEVQL